MTIRKKKTKTNGASTEPAAVAEAAATTAPVEDDGLKGPVVRDGLTYFSREDLLTFELAQFKAANADKEVKLMQANFEKLAREYHVRITHLQQQQALAERSLQSLRDKIQKRYRIEDLSKVAYDDETGLIQYPPEGVPTT